ncbi:MAG: hypothetical protein PHX98_03395 [Candidatus Moranbacteria bacterium]|nr:hypothetical protein [Candidatus Moranbacteria bacterium]
MNFPEKNIEVPQKTFLELPLEKEKEKDYEKLEIWLAPLIGKEGAEQCVFVLKTMEGENFLNHCDEAVKEFGKRLNERLGDEESFFDLCPSARYMTVRSEKSLDKIGYICEHHDIGMLEIPKNKEREFIVFDLSYGNVMREGRRKAIAVSYFSGERRELLEKIKNKYGGKWEIKFELDKKKGNFVFQDN